MGHGPWPADAAGPRMGSPGSRPGLCACALVTVVTVRLFGVIGLYDRGHVRSRFYFTEARKQNEIPQETSQPLRVVLGDLIADAPLALICGQHGAS